MVLIQYTQTSNISRPPHPSITTNAHSASLSNTSAVTRSNWQLMTTLVNQEAVHFLARNRHLTIVPMYAERLKPLIIRILDYTRGRSLSWARHMYSRSARTSQISLECINDSRYVQHIPYQCKTNGKQVSGKGKQPFAYLLGIYQEWTTSSLLKSPRQFSRA